MGYDQIVRRFSPMTSVQFKRLLRVRVYTFLYMVNGIWAIPCVLFIRAISHWKVIRIGPILNARIGHFVADGAEQLSRWRIKSDNSLDFYYLESKQSANLQWESMLKRCLPFPGRFIRFIDAWNKIIPGSEVHHRPTSESSSRDIHGYFAQEYGRIEFEKSENQAGYDWLQSKGWTFGEPFVCILVRDEEFLATHPITGDGSARSRDIWSYHSYRNSKIETYLGAVRWLVEQGVWVIRMGKIAERKLDFQHSKFIDYAFIEERSDLLDIWLFANATATISTGTGPDIIANIYNRPVLYLNFLPTGLIHSWANSTTSPKNLIDKTTSKCVSLDRNILSHFGATSEFSDHGIEIVDLTSDEIMREVEEFWDHLETKNVSESSDKVLQSLFWKALENWPEYKKFHGWRHPNCKVSSTWLKNTI